MSLKETLIRFLFPERCPLCRELLPLDVSTCPGCRDTAKRIPPDFCEHCGAEAAACQCSNDSVKFSHFTAVYIYSGLTRARIHKFKFDGDLRTGRSLGDEMSFRAAEVFYSAKFDIVTFVPMTRSAEKKRGYNQSEILARQLAKRFFIPCQELLVKVRETPSQHTLNSKERQSNLENAFATAGNADIKGKTVVLCDDIKTTGTTLKKCESLLFDMGARDVYCISIAMTDYGDIFRPLDKQKQSN